MEKRKSGHPMKEEFKLKDSTARRSMIIMNEIEMRMRIMWLNNSAGDFWKSLSLGSSRYNMPRLVSRWGLVSLNEIVTWDSQSQDGLTQSYTTTVEASLDCWLSLSHQTDLTGSLNPPAETRETVERCVMVLHFPGCPLFANLSWFYLEWQRDIYFWFWI